MRHGGGHGADGFVRSHEHVRVDVRLHRLRRARGRDGRHRRNRRGSREERVPARWRVPGASLVRVLRSRRRGASSGARAETRRARTTAGANARAGAIAAAIDVLPVGRRTRRTCGGHTPRTLRTPASVPGRQVSSGEKCSLERTHVVGCVLYRFQSQPAPRHSERGGRLVPATADDDERRRDRSGSSPEPGARTTDLRQQSRLHRERGGAPEKAPVLAERHARFRRASDRRRAPLRSRFSTTTPPRRRKSPLKNRNRVRRVVREERFVRRVETHRASASRAVSAGTMPRAHAA